MLFKLMGPLKDVGLSWDFGMPAFTIILLIFVVGFGLFFILKKITK
jgi:hypothetical protein